MKKKRNQNEVTAVHKVANMAGNSYMGTSLIRNIPFVGPYWCPVSEDLW